MSFGVSLVILSPFPLPNCHFNHIRNSLIALVSSSSEDDRSEPLLGSRSRPGTGLVQLFLEGAFRDLHLHLHPVSQETRSRQCGHGRCHGGCARVLHLEG